MAATTVHSTTYKWVRELPIPCKYVQERGAPKDLGLDFGLASATIEVFVAGERFPKPHRTSLVQECGIGVVPGARTVPNAHVFSSTYKLERLDLIKELNLMLALSQGRWHVFF